MRGSFLPDRVADGHIRLSGVAYPAEAATPGACNSSNVTACIQSNFSAWLSDNTATFAGKLLLRTKDNRTYESLGDQSR